MRMLVLATLVLAACGSRSDPPLQGYIEGEYVRVAAPFAGTLQQLSVKRGDEVIAGAPGTGNALASVNQLAQSALAHDLTGPLASLAGKSGAFEILVHPRYNPESVAFLTW